MHAHVPVLPQGRQRWKAGKAKTTVKQNCGNLLPPGLLHAAKFAIIAAARLVVMNLVMSDKHGRRALVVVNLSKRHERLPPFYCPVFSSVPIQVTLRNQYILCRGHCQFAWARLVNL